LERRKEGFNTSCACDFSGKLFSIQHSHASKIIPDMASGSPNKH